MAVFRRGMGGNGRTPHFLREKCISRMPPAHTFKMRISDCVSRHIQLISPFDYRAENSPSHPNGINYFQLYLGERIPIGRLIAGMPAPKHFNGN